MSNYVLEISLKELIEIGFENLPDDKLIFVMKGNKCIMTIGFDRRNSFKRNIADEQQEEKKMSWEGYSQNFCVKGHFFEGTAGYDGTPKVCEFCNSKIAITNIVDDTNCNSVNKLNPEILKSWMILDQKIQSCDLGHSHVVSEAVYKVPSREEVEAARGWVPYWNGKERKWEPFPEKETE